MSAPSAPCSRCGVRDVERPWSGTLCNACQDALAVMTRAEIDADYLKRRVQS